MRWLMAAVLLAVAMAAPCRVATAEVDATLRAKLAMAQTVRVVVEQVYTHRLRNRYRAEPIDGYSMPFAAVARELLEGAGLRVVDGDTMEADATLTIGATGRAIGRLYAIQGAGYLYAGAEIEGDIVFAAAGLPAWHTPFIGRQQPPLEVHINLGYDRPANAPFEDVFALPGSFLPRITQVIATVYGPTPLIAALDTGDPALRASAARALGDLGEPYDDAVVDSLVAILADADAELRRQAAWSLGRLGDVRAIEPLKARLRDGNADVRWFAAWALARITGATLDEMLATASDDNEASRVE